MTSIIVHAIKRIGALARGCIVSLAGAGVLLTGGTACADVEGEEESADLLAAAKSLGWGDASAKQNRRQQNMVCTNRPIETVAKGENDSTISPPTVHMSAPESPTVGSQTPTQEELRTTCELLAWMKGREKRTSAQDEQEFKRYIGKRVAFKGEIENVRTGSSGVEVDLVVGKIDLFERLIVGFDVGISHAAEAVRWHKGDVCALRGRVVRREFGFIADVICVCDEIVDPVWIAAEN